MEGVDIYMKLYEVLEDYGGYEPGQSFGLFSTYEKANNFIKMFEGYDGFGISEDDLYIKEVEIIPDVIADWVVDLLNVCKQNKKMYEEQLKDLE